MASRHKNIVFRCSLLTIAVGLILMAASVAAGKWSTNPEKAAARTERHIEKRVKVLDEYMKTMASDSEVWTQLDKLPEDMVVYRYVGDTLQCWNNRFPIINDDIKARLRFQRMIRPEFEITSPLNNVGKELTFTHLGSKWYLAKWYDSGDMVKVLGAIELASATAEGRADSYNRRLALKDNYEIYPIGLEAGSTVKCGNLPLFTLRTPNNAGHNDFLEYLLRWVGLLLIVLACISMLASDHNRRRFSFTLGVIALGYLLSFLWSRNLADSSIIFSPALYAGKCPCPNFGMMIVLNLCIFLDALSIFFMRCPLLTFAKRHGRCGEICYSALLVAGVAAICCYTIFSIRDLMLNSSIVMELQWTQGINGYSLAIIASYSLLLEGIVLMLYMLSPRIRAVSGKKINAFSLTAVSLWAFLFAVSIFFVSMKMELGRESGRVSIWANRLAVDRNLSLELQLRSAESRIVTDNFIPVFADLKDYNSLISTEVREEYFGNLSDYTVGVSVCSSDDRVCNNIFNSKLVGGSQLAPDSHFFCSYDNNGRAKYTGSFYFVSREGRLIRMLIEINSRANREEGGYYSLFSDDYKARDISVPNFYSYAKFIDGRLASYKGTYTFPTVLSEPFVSDTDANYSFREAGYKYFVNAVSDDEVVIIVRRTRSLLSVITSVLSIFAIAFIMMIPFVILGRRHGRVFKRTFKNRITTTLTVTVFIALIVLAGVSVKFVYDRNITDTNNMMSDKISAIQNIIESMCPEAEDLSSIDKSEWRNLLQNVSTTTRSDLSLFTPKGMIYASTAEEMYSRAVLSCRINGEAYHSIIQNHQRMYLQKETIDGKSFFSLYAPVFNGRGDTIAIVNAPDNRKSEVIREALPHAILLLILLLAIVIVSIATASHIIDRIFNPLTKIGHKMESAGNGNLEQIEYKHNDEISVLVEAYNGMVNDLAESNRLLAQRERDKAWSEMARQVAHEIKNPLTPISLQIQTLMYLKQKNDPRWIDMFDKTARLIREQISILTDTANEFSTFAKLYSEDPVELDLDAILQDQVDLFNNREGIEITYLGYRNAVILGPKPQLVRMFVNLLTNAVQAIEIKQKAAEREGLEKPLGKIRIELRNDIGGDCYEIAFDDNGPGVSEENKAKLFTPNFTTKTGGTGLGLAICRNIVEKCNGSITYKKSFTLNGACFMVRLPKQQNNA